MAHFDRFGQAGHRPMTGPAVVRKQVEEQVLKTEKLQVERKSFTLTLRENPRGRFLRITEDVAGRRDHIIVPSTGLAEFARVLANLAKTSDALPPMAPPAEGGPGEASPPPAPTASNS
jgi:hypothetical protein